MESINQPKTLVEQTCEILLDAICSGELAAGERLNQDEIATRLNVSRQPVNSALSVLKSHGFVTDNGRRGVTVAPIDAEQFQYIYEYRTAIEPFAVTLAAKNLPDNAETIAQEMLKKGNEAVRSGDQKAWLVADMAFHEMIYQWGGNTVIQSSMRLNWQHIRRTMAEVLKDASAAKVSWDEHTRIIQALLGGESDKAALEMRKHIEAAHKKTFASLGTSSHPATAI